jgi:type I restriction enzyme S subunit
MLQAGDILISTANSKELVGKSCLINRPPFPCTFGAFVSVARPTEIVYPPFLSYWMMTREFLSWCFTQSSNTTNISNLRVSELEELEFRLPDLSEQRRIAGLLEQADRLRRTCRYAVELTDTVLPAAFLGLFGDPIANVHGFPIKPLEDLVQPARPISYGILMPGPDIPGGVPYVRVTDIQEGQIVTARVRRTTTEIDQAYRRSKLKAGDLLLSIRGHVGRMAVVPARLDGANITQDTARLATLDTLEPHYLMGCLSSSGMQRRMDDLTRGAAVQGINLGDVKELPIPVPPIPLQLEYSSLVKRVERLRAVQREVLRQADHLFASLLSRAFAVESDEVLSI